MGLGCRGQVGGPGSGVVAESGRVAASLASGERRSCVCVWGAPVSMGRARAFGAASAAAASVMVAVRVRMLLSVTVVLPVCGGRCRLGDHHDPAARLQLGCNSAPARLLPVR